MDSLLDLIFHLNTCVYFIAKTSCGWQTTAHQPNCVVEMAAKPWEKEKLAFQTKILIQNKKMLESSTIL